MSTSRNTKARAGDDLVTVLSLWLARHIDDDELRRAVETSPRAELDAESADAVEELRGALARPAANRGDLERLVRETLEAVALGG